MVGHSLSLRVLLRTQRYFCANIALNLDTNKPFKSQFDTKFFTQKLLKEQLPDGSWKQLVDENQKEGSLDATIFNCTIDDIQIGT